MSDMDETSWSQLPLDILQRVVSLLPLVPLFRCRVVCKQWNAWINELSHPQTPAQIAEVFIVSNCFRVPDLYWFALDTSINKWYKIDWRSWGIEPHILLAARKRVVLAKVNVEEGDPEQLFVCDPAASTVRSEEIPELRVPGSCYEIVVDDNTKSYKVYLLSDLDVLGRKFDRLISEYNSTDNSWTKLCSIPELSSNCVADVYIMTISEEFVHLLVLFESEPDELNFHSVLSYSMIENSWDEVVGSEIPMFLRDDIRIYHMLMYRGQLLLVGGREAITNYCGYRIRASVLVWRFSFRKKECVMIAEMPPSILRTVQTGKLSVSGRGDRIFFLSRKTKMVIYCVRDHSWHCPPDLAAHDRLPEFARCALFQKFISFAVVGVWP